MFFNSILDEDFLYTNDVFEERFEIKDRYTNELLITVLHRKTNFRLQSHYDVPPVTYAELEAEVTNSTKTISKIKNILIAKTKKNI